MKISLVVVNFHSAAQVRKLAEAVVGQVDEIVVVDHSDSAAEAVEMASIGGVRVLAQANLGYGAGLNRGVAAASGELLVLSNPDVLPKPGAIETLCDHVVRRGVGAVGPTLIWDEQHAWRLPQAQHVTWWSEWLAARRPERARRRYLRQQLRLWHADGAIRTPVLSGTFLVTTRKAFQAGGGFDPGYFLFYEENDWCRRLARAGLRCQVVPHALVQHQVGVSAADSGVEHLEKSYRRYRRLWFPWWFRKWQTEPMVPAALAVHEAATTPKPTDGARWAVSPTSAFVPVALGPPVAACPEFPQGLPKAIEDSWHAGWLTQGRITNLGPARR